MPLYEYQCTQCSSREEVIQKMTDPPLEQCAKCGGAMKKLFSSPAIQFKGSGFYKTDYASASSAPPSTSSGTSESGDSSSAKKVDASSSSDSSSSSSSSSTATTSSPAPAKSETKSDTK
jgi:putative FmdB family regulatory protein